MLQSTPSARSHPIIGSTQANNWWPITRNWSIVCMRNILGVCWSKQEEDWWVWLLYKSRAINLHCKEKVQGKKLEDMWIWRVLLGLHGHSHWYFFAWLIAILDESIWHRLLAWSCRTTTPRVSSSAQLRWIGTVHRCVVQIGISETMHRWEDISARRSCWRPAHAPLTTSWPMRSGTQFQIWRYFLQYELQLRPVGKHKADILNQPMLMSIGYMA